MSRPLRLEYEGALYHVTSRGDRRSTIFHDDNGRLEWLSLLKDACDRYNFVIYAFCQMTNHYHLMVETVDGGLNRGIRHLNATYAQYVNRRHGFVGHVFQGRYKAILCQKESYLLELSRYIVLNPVRANLVSSADEWRWSSHRYLVGTDPAPHWLATDGLLSHFGSDRSRAIQAYEEFVARGLHVPSPLDGVQHQFLLGDGAFVSGYFGATKPDELTEIARVQRKPTAQPLEYYFEQSADRDVAIAHAFETTAFSMSEIAKHCGVCVRTVSRAVKRGQRKLRN